MKIDYSVSCKVAFETFGKHWGREQRKAFAQARREINMLKMQISGNCTDCKKSYPSTATMAKNLGSTIISSASRALTGKSVVAPSSVAVKREMICKHCQNYDSSQSRCTVCGCNMAAKTRISASYCPMADRLWGPYNGPQDDGIFSALGPDDKKYLS